MCSCHRGECGSAAPILLCDTGGLPQSGGEPRGDDTPCQCVTGVRVTPSVRVSVTGGWRWSEFDR